MFVNSHSALQSPVTEASRIRALPATRPQNELQHHSSPAAEDPPAANSVTPTRDASRLNEAETRELQQLKARDREVRAHEQAHIAAGGSLTQGGARYTYQQGPDGRNYAVGGEVSIGSAEVAGNPEKTLQNAEQIQRAAMAPADPSAQDRAVAAQAAAAAAKARGEIAQERRRETAEAEPNAAVSPDSNAESTPPGEDAGLRRTSRRSEVVLYESVARILDQAPTAGPRERAPSS